MFRLACVPVVVSQGLSSDDIPNSFVCSLVMAWKAGVGYCAN